MDVSSWSTAFLIYSSKRNFDERSDDSPCQQPYALSVIWTYYVFFFIKWFNTFRVRAWIHARVPSGAESGAIFGHTLSRSYCFQVQPVESCNLSVFSLLIWGISYTFIWSRGAHNRSLKRFYARSGEIYGSANFSHVRRYKSGGLKFFWWCFSLNLKPPPRFNWPGLWDIFANFSCVSATCKPKK